MRRSKSFWAGEYWSRHGNSSPPEPPATVESGLKRTPAHPPTHGFRINPWASRISLPDKPDFMTLDLDPSASNSFDDVIAVAQCAHRVLDGLQLKNYCKTSGKTGLHVLVPVAGKYTFAQVRRFAKLLTARIYADMPALATTQHRAAKRRGKVYLDYMRNAVGQTSAAPYSLRPWPGATVSTPLEWPEVKEGLRPEQFTIRTIFRRLKAKGDLLKPMLNQGTDLDGAIRSLEADSRKSPVTGKSQ